MDIAQYKTSPARLLRILAHSRDSWRRRVAAKQREIRRLRVKVRDLELSRDSWKRRATATAVPHAPAAPSGPGEARASRR